MILYGEVLLIDLSKTEKRHLGGSKHYFQGPLLLRGFVPGLGTYRFYKTKQIFEKLREYVKTWWHGLTAVFPIQVACRVRSLAQSLRSVVGRNRSSRGLAEAICQRAISSPQFQLQRPLIISIYAGLFEAQREVWQAWWSSFLWGLNSGGQANTIASTSVIS